MAAPGWSNWDSAEAVSETLAVHAVGTSVLIYCQIVLGAVTRHQNAGLIIPDFPLSYGKLVPEFNDWRVALNFSHRVGAVLVTLASISLVWRVLSEIEDAWLRGPAKILAIAVLIQFSLGAATVLSRLNPFVASSHVIGGAFVLASCIALALRLLKSRGILS
jgi:cytochrome c oxidase assembly protein subunit 15